MLSFTYSVPSTNPTTVSLNSTTLQPYIEAFNSDVFNVYIF